MSTVGHRGIRGPLAERFWQYISPEPNSGCWLWDGGLCRGYGVISVGGKNGRQRLASHVSLELVGRPRPSSSYEACHHCDVPACVNPEHLYWGTGRENRADMFARGRANLPFGSGHLNSKLSEEAIRYIRGSDKLHRVLAAELSVSRQLISRVKSGVGWEHVE